MFFFFFQAEDGIRDYKVTGVQTCALPIFARFARGDWGRSIATGRPVRALLGEAVPATVELVGLSLVLSYLLGIAVGALQVTAGPRVDAALSVTTVTLFALPGYWLGLLLVMAFTYLAGWLPAV